MEAVELKRVFIFKDESLSDPGRHLTSNEVLELYCNEYPELNNASVSGPELKNNQEVYTFDVNVGTKG